MKIAYIIHGLYNSGGMEHILSEKANALARDYSYDITIITSEQRGRSPFFPLDERIRIHDIGVNYHLRAFTRKLEKYLFELRPDVTVSLCGGEIHNLAKIKDGSVKVAELHFSHDRYFFRPGKGLLHDLIARKKTRALEKAAGSMAKFVVLTKSDLRVWDSIIHNAVQIYNFNTASAVPAARLDAPRCICVSRLTASKNLFELIDAWSIAVTHHPDWILDIYGRGNLKNKLLRYISKNGLEGKVMIHPPVKDIANKMSGSSCFLLSSLNEGMGLVLVEAASCGLPCIAYDCKCGPSEIIADGKTGYLVKPHDIHGFADKICRIIENPELRSQMGHAARADARRFSKEAIIPQWDAFFNSLKGGTCR